MEQQFLTAFGDILELQPDEINMDDTFRDYDAWDSLASLSVIAMLDEEFGVHIESGDFTAIQTVGQLIEEVKKRMA